MAIINLGAIKFNWRGAYNGATAYAVDDVVSSGGSSYVCILASTGNATSNGTYWELMSSAGTNGTNGTDVGTTLTTQGDILYRDGSGLQRLAKGTAGQVLQMNSGATAPEYADASGGGAWTLLNTQTVSNTATLDFESIIDSTYNLYAIHIFDFRPVTNGEQLKLQTSQNNGASYNSSAYQYHTSILASTSGSYASAAATAATSYLLSDSVKSDDLENFHGMVYISSDFSSAYQPKFWHQAYTKNGGGTSMYLAGGGAYNGSMSYPTNALRLVFSSGNISSGTATLYGLAKS